ncbi:MAG TPA: NUDIX domain-containing protein [Clostridia bacterium]|nr:NUDIX domain-containing protein [Clostridia bacterium]
MELWDVLDEDGNLTGKTIERGQSLKDGEYHLVVNIWIKNSKGEYLIQKRSEKVERWPGIWAATGGSAIKGENSSNAALREVKEELGISFKPDMLERVIRVKRKNVISDLWLACHDVDLKDIRMQKEEVSEVKYAGMREIFEMMASNEFFNYGQDYMSLLY